MSLLQIESLGRRGDGIARSEDGIVYVPFALPGETVEAVGSGPRRRIGRIVATAPDRIEPVCRHFGACGGCQLQHMGRQASLEWKRRLVADALERQGIEAEVAPAAAFGTGRRRRLVFACQATRSAVRFGFSRQASNDVVDIAECPVAVPAIERALPDLRRIAATLLGGRGELRLTVLAGDGWLDVAATGRRPPGEKERRAAVSLALETGIARLSGNGEILVETRRPLLACGEAWVSPPPGGFVQAVEGAERAMADAVCGHLSACRQAADLFCGHGAFALRLAKSMAVDAYDGSGPAIEALDRAWRETAGLLKTVHAEKRDLFRRPVTAAELRRHDGAVFDPPRAGAELQAGELARSGVARVAAVSCNPVTLARDMALLIAGGFRPVSVKPIDQFVFTPHVEAVALMER